MKMRSDRSAYQATASILSSIALILVVLLSAQASGPLEQGVAMYEAGRYADALPFLLRAVKLEAKSARAWTWLGAAYIHLNRPRDAVGPLRRAVTLDPRGVAAHFFLGVAYVRLGDVSRARDAFQRVRVLDPGSSYDAAASEWMNRLSSPGRTPSAPAARSKAPPPAGPPSCPQPTSVPPPEPPPAVKSEETPVQIVDWEFAIRGENLEVGVEVENTGDQDIQNVRLQALGFGLNGRQVARAVTPQGLILQQGRDKSVTVTLKLSTRPPVIWVHLQILDYSGRRPNEPLHTVLAPVDMQEYEALAKARIKIALAVVPVMETRRHSICLQITDAAGFPIQAVRVRVELAGSASGLNLRQEMSVDVTADSGKEFKVEWSHPVTAKGRVEIESIRFTPLPRLRNPD